MAAGLKLRVRDPELFLADCATRLPFRFGGATFSRASLLTIRVRVETESGASAPGCAADLLVPKWFDKDPSRSARENEEDLLASVRRAAATFTARDLPPLALFDSWWRVYQQRVGREPEPSRALVDGFGVALLERAAIDGLCRAARVPFFQALQQDLFGFAPGLVHRELVGFDLARALPAAPRREILVRHTIGLVDALRRDDVEPSARANDGLPESLEEDVAAYGLRCFKVKLGGDPTADRVRLLRVAEVLRDRVPSFDVGTEEGMELTLDGNEQYATLADLERMLQGIRAEELGARLLHHLRYVEQPLDRTRSFEAAERAALARLSELAPLLLDEGDLGVDAFPRAARLGWRGVSVKNCKGVFRALLNRALCETSGGRLFQSAEDLTNLPVIALQEDLATIAALGIRDAERNGHHYFRGLRHLPAAEAAAALELHADLYESDAAGARLRIRDGKLAIGSIQCEGFGYAVPFHAEARTRLAPPTSS